METMKETAAQITASAKSGMEKVKAAVEEKVEKMTTADPVEKEMAEQEKEEGITEAELRKREEWERNATGSRADASATGEVQSYKITREQGRPTGMHEMSALPGHRTGEPASRVVPSHPIGVATGTDRPSTAHNPRVGYGSTNKCYGSTGGAYTYREYCLLV